MCSFIFCNYWLHVKHKSILTTSNLLPHRPQKNVENTTSFHTRFDTFYPSYTCIEEIKKGPFWWWWWGVNLVVVKPPPEKKFTLRQAPGGSFQIHPEWVCGLIGTLFYDFRKENRIFQKIGRQGLTPPPPPPWGGS